MSRIITMAELQTRSLQELQALYRKTEQELTRSRYGTPERRNALATLENIACAIRTVRMRPRSGGPRA